MTFALYQEFSIFKCVERYESDKNIVWCLTGKLFSTHVTKCGYLDFGGKRRYSYLRYFHILILPEKIRLNDLVTSLLHYGQNKLIINNVFLSWSSIDIVISVKTQSNMSFLSDNTIVHCCVFIKPINECDAIESTFYANNVIYHKY